MIDHVDRAVGRVSTSLAFLGAGILGLLAVLIVADILGRELGMPIRGTVEIAAMTVASATFLTIPYTMRKRGHIRSTIVVSRLPERLGRSMEVFAYLLGAALFAFVAVYSYDAAVTAFTAGSYEGEGALRVPTFPTRWIIVIGSAAMSAESLLAAIHAGRGTSRDE